MTVLLQYCYTDTTPPLDESNAMEALQTAKFFQVDRLAALCESVLKVCACAVLAGT